jgi:prenyltransferase beta subunit
VQFDLIDGQSARAFHLKCQDLFYGGFSKYPEHLPDVLHAFYSVRHWGS